MTDILKIKQNGQWVGIPAIKGENGVGVPTGGTQGQVLAKVSGTDYDTEWVEQSSIPETDNETISLNTDNELQAIAVKDNNSNAIKTWTGTKAQYNAIATKDANTLYNVKGDNEAVAYQAYTKTETDSLLLEKANIDLSNISATGESLISGLGMPSIRYNVLTLGASGTYYTPPANGYYYIECTGMTTSQYFCFAVYPLNGSSILYGTRFVRPAAQSYMNIYIPVSKNCKVKVDYTISSTAYANFRFIYAEGEN